MDIGHVLVSIADSFESAHASAQAERTAKPEAPPDLNLTQRVVTHMLREDTGASILDSGGAYGRHWQRNQSVPFWEQPRATVEFWARDGELETNVTINLWHFLCDKLDYDRAMTRQLQKFAALPENERESWLDIGREFPAWYREKFPVSRYSRGDATVCTEYTYNVDNFLSQDVQYTLFEYEHEQYVLLQVHGGCDARGGLSEAKAFKCTDEWSICDYYRATVAPDWQEVKEIRARLLQAMSEQTYLFASEEASVKAEIESLGGDVWWDVGANNDHGEGCEKLDDYPVLEIGTRDQWVKGSVCVLPDHSALCPVTGAKLVANFM